MARRLDYSKWDHIEVSDDEDDTHPNIDTPSLFRWRHQARLDREKEWKKEKSDFDKSYKDHLSKLNDAKQKYQKAKDSATGVDEAKKAYDDMLEKDTEWDKKREEMDKKERLKPWNVDTISHETKSRTIINKVEDKPSEPANEEEAFDRMKTFVDKHEKEIKTFGMFRKPEDAEQYLLKNTHLVCEDTANQLVLWCIDLAIEEKTDLMNHVSHQCIVMQFMLELAKSMKIDPRACIRPFYAKFKSPEPEYHKAFNDELSAFRDRIKGRAEVRIKEAMEKYEEEEKQKRLGPGGLDPVEVYDSLPESLQKCFDSKDIQLLQTTLEAMDIKDAENYLDRCIKSGLWVPDARAQEAAQLEDDKKEAGPEPATQQANENGDEIYSTPVQGDLD